MENEMCKNCKHSRPYIRFTVLNSLCPVPLVSNPHQIQSYFRCSTPVRGQIHTKHSEINMIHEFTLPSLQLSQLYGQCIEPRNSYRQKRRPTPGPADTASHSVPCCIGNFLSPTSRFHRKPYIGLFHPDNSTAIGVFSERLPKSRCIVVHNPAS
jgi:hypothetical protein